MSTVPPLPQEAKSPLYTPFQVRIASFLGGPIAAIYTLHFNFKRMEKKREASLALYWGIAFVIALLGIIPFLPDRFPNMLLPFVYSIAAGGIANSKQLSKEAILASPHYTRHSAWNVVAVTLISLIVMVAIALPALLALDYFGIISLE